MFCRHVAANTRRLIYESTNAYMYACTQQHSETQQNKERQETALTVPLNDPPPPVPVSPFLSSSIGGGGGAFVRQEHRDLTKRGKMSQQTKTA